MGNDVKFKDTIMGKITKGAIISWGENDEKGDWFQPTEEQAEQMLTEGGLQLGEKNIDYSSSEKATNEKTYGSEIAAINGLVALISKGKEISEEEKKTLSDQIKSEVYTAEHLSPEIEEKVKGTIEGKGIESSTLEILSTIHDNWVKTNPNNFMKENRNKERQFVPLELLDWKEVQSDLLFLKPILEGAGITLDEEQLRKEFETRQQEYMIDHKIFSHEDLVKHLAQGSKTYSALEGLETVNGGNIDKLLENPEIVERMARQIESRVAIKSREELAMDVIKSDAQSLDEVLWVQTVQRDNPSFNEEKLPYLDNPISKREIMLSKLIGKPYPTYFLDGISDYNHDSYRNEILTPIDERLDHADNYERRISERKITGEEKDSNKKGIIQFGFDESAKRMDGHIKISESELLRAGLDPEQMGLDYDKTKVTPKDIAEADNKQKLTTTEVGENKGLIDKLKELFKGKGEK